MPSQILEGMEVSGTVKGNSGPVTEKLCGPFKGGVFIAEAVSRAGVKGQPCSQGS